MNRYRSTIPYLKTLKLFQNLDILRFFKMLHGIHNHTLCNTAIAVWGRSPLIRYSKAFLQWNIWIVIASGIKNINNLCQLRLGFIVRSGLFGFQYWEDNEREKTVILSNSFCWSPRTWSLLVVLLWREIRED